MSEHTFAKNLALIGAGYWGKNLARNFYALGALHTLCDTNEALIDNYLKLYPDIVTTSSVNTLLTNPEITRVAIAAPAFQHYTLAKQALLANKDVYVEKPLCLNTEEAEELVTLAQKQEKILMVGHLLHYHPCVKKLQETVNNGDIGELQYIVSNRLNLGSYRTEENALWNFAPHDVSVILSLCGHQLPNKIRCVGGTYITSGVTDACMTLLSFPNNLKAHIFVSWLHPFKEQKLTVVGSKGMIVFDDTKPWGEKLNLYREHVQWTDTKVPFAPKVDAINIDPIQKEPLREECIHFLTCCDQKKEPITDGQEGLRVLKVLQAAQESLDSDGEAIHLEVGVEKN
jgi:UDP-2-acetamido-3-amino-2,3-dideoxy-glucuronate N-acetyltransferase